MKEPELKHTKMENSNMPHNLTYEEFEKAVYEECLKDATAQTYREDFEKVFEESKENIKKDYEEGNSIADVAWGICLLI